MMWLVLLLAFPLEVFQSANDAYAEGDFARAESLYLSIVDTRSPVVMYNLGNVEYKLENKGTALLWYERALRYSFYDDEILHNIDLLRGELGVEHKLLSPGEWFSHIVVKFLGVQWVVWMLGIAVSVWCILLGSFLMFRGVWGKLCAIWTLVVLMCAILWLGFFIDKHLRFCIVIGRGQMMSAPIEEGEGMRDLKEGEYLRVRSRDGEWLEVVDDGGVVGWVKANAVGQIWE